MKENNRSLIVVASIAILVAAVLFAIDRKTSTGTTLIVLTVTPAAPVASTSNSVSDALPNFSDFLKTDGAVVQAADAAPVPMASSVTGWLDPSLGKVVIVEGVNKKIKCEGLDGNQDFTSLSPSQQMLVKDTCSQL